MSSSDIEEQLGPALIDFATNGTFPEEAVSAAYVHESALPAALIALNDAKIALETEIRQISSESAPDVDTWITHAKSLQEDIIASRKLASDIVRRAEADEERLDALQDAEFQVTFLEKETAFNAQLGETLHSLQQVNNTLDKSEELAIERNIVNAIQSLEVAWNIMSKVPIERSTRAIQSLETRWFDLREVIHEQFRDVCNALIHFDFDERTLMIHKKLENEATNLDDVLIGMQSFKEVEEIGKKMWKNLDETIVKPRTDPPNGTIRKMEVHGNCLSLSEDLADHTIKSLFLELEEVIRFLTQHLPSELIKSLSNAMMPTLSTRLKEVWLDTAVPSSLDDMIDYQKALAQVNDFAMKIDSLDWPPVHAFHDWVSNSSKIWLSKRRESSLDWTRNQLSLGIGVPQFAERIEKQMVARDERMQIESTGNMVTQDWDSAWDSDQEDEPEKQSVPSKNRASIDEEKRHSQISTPVTTPVASSEDDQDDAADAWGWGDDEDTTEEPVTQKNTQYPAEVRPLVNRKHTPELRELTLTEPYWTSSLPKPVLNTVVEIYNDGARLTRPDSEQNPVTTAAPGLFSLPTLILALYRAVSPYYYAKDPSGNMFLYNDAMWLCDNLRDFASEWAQRGDLTPRAYGMVKLDPEIKVLESFGKRAYTNELNAQRTIINDLLGGAQNFLQQDDLESGIVSIVEHIRQMHALWKQILPISALTSATGSLVNAVATKLINDVFDLSDMGVDEAERTARLIAKVTELDDLFIREPEKGGNQNGEERISMTAQFADKWMKMKFLSEVLQSNLKDIKFFWFESDLSLYFTKEEVVDLINLSFENNASVRQAIKEILQKPLPREVDE